MHKHIFIARNLFLYFLH